MKRTPIPKSLRFDVLERDNYSCRYCGQHGGHVVLHVDHVQSVAGGGRADMENLATSCAACNFGKGGRQISPFIEGLREVARGAFLYKLACTNFEEARTYDTFEFMMNCGFEVPEYLAIDVLQRDLPWAKVRAILSLYQQWGKDYGDPNSWPDNDNTEDIGVVL